MYVCIYNVEKKTEAKKRNVEIGNEGHWHCPVSCLGTLVYLIGSRDFPFSCCKLG